MYTSLPFKCLKIKVSLPREMLMSLSPSLPFSHKTTNSLVRLTAVAMFGILLWNCSR